MCEHKNMTIEYDREYKGNKNLLSTKEHCPDCGYEHYEMYEKVRESIDNIE